MRDDVSPDRLLRVLHELLVTAPLLFYHGRSPGIRSDLVDNHHRHVELLSHYSSFSLSHCLTFFQRTQMSAQLLLALSQLASPAVVDSEERGDRIDHLAEEWKQTVPASDRGSCPPRFWPQRP